jgi:hypothetical protein
MARPGDIGTFVQLWSRFESNIRQRASSADERRFGVPQAIEWLLRTERIDNLRTFRNQIIHRTAEVAPDEMVQRIEEIRAVMRQLNISDSSSA